VNTPKLLVTLTGTAVAAVSCQSDKPVQTPNIVFILADDLGWGDLSSYGQQRFSTPNIDALATHGMRFTQAYSGTTVSAPSRSCLITGTHSGHTAIRGNLEIMPEGQFPLPADTQTLFEDLQAAGYRTGAFGKWGLGVVGSTGEPARQGIDRFYGYNCQRLAHSYYPDHLWEDDQLIILEDNTDAVPYGEGTYAPDLIHQKSLEFLEESVQEGKPFFLWYPTTLPHAELIVPQDSILARFLGQYPETPYQGIDDGPYFRKGGYASQAHPHATFAAMVTRLDHYVGEIVQQLKDLGVYENTLIIFASDNGPHQEGGHDPDFFDSNGPWRGYKRDLYEGGVRVPLIVSWPGHIREGAQTDFACAFWDLMPTLRELTGTEGADNLDGVSLLPLLSGKGNQPEHDYLYFEFQELGGRQAVRKGPWKLIALNVRSETPVYELYNLDEDPSETTNLAADRPQKVQELKAILEESHTTNSAFPLLPEEQ